MTRLPGLDFVRFYAAFSVLIYHIVQAPFFWFGADRLESPLSFVLLDGDDAVTLFFVLSGFLVTYLLFKEKTSTGEVNAGRFYARRMLRIFPLYYLVYAIGALIPIVLNSPNFLLDSDPTIHLMIVLFSAHIARGFGASMGVIEHLWTIGVEEWFYAVWPWIMRWARSPLVIFSALLLLKIVINEWALASDNDIIGIIIGYARFEAMLIGAIAAYILYFNPLMTRVLRHPVIVVLTFISLALVVSGSWRYPNSSVTLSVFFALMLLHATARQRRFLDTPTTRWLGDLSYGIYMWHMLILFVTWVTADGLRLHSDLRHPFMFVMTTILTIVVSAASFRWIETPFLRLKDTRFRSEVIQSA